MNKEEQKKLITEIMNEDAKDGLYTQLTAIDWIYGKIVYEQTIKSYTPKEWQEIYKQAKAMEKKQIMFAYGDGQQNGRECEQKLSNGEDCNVITSLQYYNETYK